MARIPAAQENTMLDAGFVTSTTYYLSLHTADPGTNGANEVSGGSYARQAITFGASSAGVKVSTNSQSFTLPVEAGGCPYFGVWTLVSSGTYLGGGTTTGLSGSIPVGTVVTSGTGQVSWTLS